MIDVRMIYFNLPHYPCHYWGILKRRHFLLTQNTEKIALPSGGTFDGSTPGGDLKGCILPESNNKLLWNIHQCVESAKPNDTRLTDDPIMGLFH